jgi:hypothetical protein
MNPYIQELKDRYGLEEDFLHVLARNGESLTPVVEMLERQGDQAAAEELKSCQNC